MVCIHGPHSGSSSTPPVSADVSTATRGVTSVKKAYGLPVTSTSVGTAHRMSTPDQLKSVVFFFLTTPRELLVNFLFMMGWQASL
jgi:hypothetical protein